MKKLMMLAVASFVIVSAKAQVQTITISNNTLCNVYYRLGGNPNGGGCTGGWVSTVLTLGPTSSVTYDAGTVPGGMNCSTCMPTVLSTGDDILTSLIRDTSPTSSCTMLTRVQIGEACATPNTSISYSVQDMVCSVCAGVTATWTNLGTSATLDFN